MEPKTYKGVIKFFEQLSAEVQGYYGRFPELVESFPFDIALSYLFFRLESAQHRIIYCGIIKKYRCDSRLTQKALNEWHISRDGFNGMFKNVFGHEIPPKVSEKIKHAEKVRDRIMHGKVDVKETEKRKAITDILNYSHDLNVLVNEFAGFFPFANLKGFKGAAQSIDGETSRWVLKGMGFPV